MAPLRLTIAGRYQYTPSQPARTTSLYKEYKCYDKATKRDLTLQIYSTEDPILQPLRELKHPFVHLVFDIQQTDEGLAVLLEGGNVATLSTVLERNHHLQECDALVLMKYLALGLREMNAKMISYNRLCPENVWFSTFSLIKLGYNLPEDDLPMECRPPERLEGRGPGYASDIYGLGVVMYKILFGVYPFEQGKDLMSNIKRRKFTNEEKSLLSVNISTEMQSLLESMLHYEEEHRPNLDQIVNHSLLNFPIDTDLQPYIKPKINLLPEPFIKKYLVYRPTRVLHRYEDCYQESAYMALNVIEKKMVTIYCPEIKMFEADPRKIDSYYQKMHALQGNQCEFVARVEDVDKFRQEPIIVSEYCNQGNLFNYLKGGVLTEKKVNVCVYLLALGLKQIKDRGVESIHTINCQRVMVSNGSLKLREPGMLVPSIEKRLQEDKSISYFAPELKSQNEMVSWDRSDMWSLGVLYYYLLSGSIPLSQDEQIDLSVLNTTQKNKNIIGRCLDYSVETRLLLEEFQIDNLDEELLAKCIVEDAAEEMESAREKDEVREVAKKVMFKRKKKRWFKDYNKILADSETAACRIGLRVILTILLVWMLFFGQFFIYGGLGLLKTNYYSPITLQVAFNYGTSLANITILTTNGSNIQSSYSDYSYEQFTQDLRCFTNEYAAGAQAQVSDFINSTQAIYCFSGFVLALLISALIAVTQIKLDLPTILLEAKNTQVYKKIFHYVALSTIIPSLLYSFFYLFAMEYTTQITPCYGTQSLAFPKFTSIDTLLSGDLAGFFLKVLLTVGLWAVLMLIFGFSSLLVNKVNLRLLEWKIVAPFLIGMLVFTIICRVGFGSSLVLEPTWTYKINQDIVFGSYSGLFGFFPEVLYALIMLVQRFLDWAFWYLLKLGLEGEEQVDIKRVQIVQAKYEPINDKPQQSNINMIEHEFETFQ